MISSGAEFDKLTGKSTPGFAIYHRGPDLTAIVSTGEKVWELTVTGQLYNNTWSNIGIRWKFPDYSDNVPNHKRYGLELYVNIEKVGQSILPEYTDAGAPKFDEVLDYQIGDTDPPSVMLGCHYDQQLGKIIKIIYFYINVLIFCIFR